MLYFFVIRPFSLFCLMVLLCHFIILNLENDRPLLQLLTDHEI